MGKELIDHFAKADQIFDYAARDEQQRDIDRSNQINEGDSINDAEVKNQENNLAVITGEYGNLTTKKPNTTINALGDVIFNNATFERDTKISNLKFAGEVVVQENVTVIFNNCTFKTPTTVIGNAHFIGCLFLGPITNTGTTFIIGSSNKSGAAHTGVPAGNIFGETT